MRRHALLYCSLALLAFIGTGMMLHPAGASDDSYKYLSNFSDTLDLIQKNYVEEVPVGKLLDGAYRGLLEDLDPESYYLDAKTLKRFREAAGAKPRAGIGIEVSKRHGYAIVL